MNDNMNSNQDTSKNSRTLKIDGMKGDMCIDKVKTSLGTVEGVNTKSVTQGSAVIECDEPVQSKAACDAINKAGFTATAPQHESDEHRTEKNAMGEAHQSTKNAGSRDADSIARDSKPAGGAKPRTEDKPASGQKSTQTQPAWAGKKM
jgi:copper chaperone CopZ